MADEKTASCRSPVPRDSQINHSSPPLSPDSIPQLSLGTAALVLFLLCAGFVLLRGLSRMIVGTLTLGVCAWLGFRVWQMAPALSFEWFGKSHPWVTNGLPVLAFFLAFLILRKITNFFSSPFSGGSDRGPRTLAGTVLRLLFALIPTSLLWLIGATVVHHAGSIAELKASSENTKSGQGFAEKLKSSIDSALPSSWLTALDPFADPSRLSLAKLIAAQSSPERVPEIDPSTGQPIPRAIIVEDPALQTLAREGNFSTLLRHPMLTKALADPKIQERLRDLAR